jgi:hypothetical protein
MGYLDSLSGSYGNLSSLGTSYGNISGLNYGSSSGLGSTSSLESLYGLSNLGLGSLTGSNSSLYGLSGLNGLTSGLYGANTSNGANQADLGQMMQQMFTLLQSMMSTLGSATRILTAMALLAKTSLIPLNLLHQMGKHVRHPLQK